MEWEAAEQRLLEASTRRIHEFELRLQHEWEALRQLHEEPIVAFEKRAAALDEAYTRAIRAAEEAVAAIVLREQLHSTIPLVAPAGGDRRWSFSRSTRAIAAAAVVLVAAAAYLAGRWSADAGGTARRALAAEQQAIASQDLAKRESTAANQAVQRLTADALSVSANAARIAGVLAAADLRRFELLPRRAAPAAEGQALWSPSRGVVISAVRVPHPPAGERYQAWLVTTLGSIGLGLVSPDAQSSISASFETPPEPAGTVTGFMLTLEPAAGSAGPSDRVALGDRARTP